MKYIYIHWYFTYAFIYLFIVWRTNDKIRCKQNVCFWKCSLLSTYGMWKTYCTVCTLKLHFAFKYEMRLEINKQDLSECIIELACGCVCWTHRKAVAPDGFIVQRDGHAHADVRSSLNRGGRDGEVLRIIPCQDHLKHAVHSLKRQNTLSALRKRGWHNPQKKKYKCVTNMPEFKMETFNLSIDIFRYFENSLAVNDVLTFVST